MASVDEGGGAPTVDQRLHLRPDTLIRMLARSCSRRGEAAQGEQVRGGVVVEPQRSGQGFEHLHRRPVVAALLQARVVVGAQSRQRGELLATQPGHATPTTVHDADVLGSDPSAPRPQELGE
jgi:hypothetical protein